jgi:hypothetical protein
MTQCAVCCVGIGPGSSPKPWPCWLGAASKQVALRRNLPRRSARCTVPRAGHRIGTARPAVLASLGLDATQYALRISLRSAKWIAPGRSVGPQHFSASGPSGRQRCPLVERTAADPRGPEAGRSARLGPGPEEHIQAGGPPGRPGPSSHQQEQAWRREVSRNRTPHRPETQVRS